MWKVQKRSTNRRGVKNLEGTTWRDVTVKDMKAKGLKREDEEK